MSRLSPAQVTVEVDYFIKKAGTAEEYNSDEMAVDFQNQFGNLALTQAHTPRTLGRYAGDIRSCGNLSITDVRWIVLIKYEYLLPATTESGN